jgi:geranylgeranyl pyrophosphate synthase
MGALLGDPGAEVADALGSFGDRIGLAFQVFDDVLDVSGPTERTGKPRGADLLDGTVTLPLILARERDPGLRALDLRAQASDAAAVAELCDRIATTGALDDAREHAQEHVSAAKTLLDGLDLPAGQRELLELVADGVAERYA